MLGARWYGRLATRAKLGRSKVKSPYTKEGKNPQKPYSKFSPPENTIVKGRIKVPKRTTLDMGEFNKLQAVTASARATHHNLLQKVTSFDELALSPKVRAAIDRMLPGAKPTPIQKVAIKALRRRNRGMRTWLMAAETGSGKTLAYLAPFFSHLEDAKLTLSRKDHPILEGEGRERKTRKPVVSAIVLVPTHELVRQVVSVAETLGVTAVTTGSPIKTTKRVAQGIDLLVSTPDSVLSWLKHAPGFSERALEECHTLVVDEADSLLHESFRGTTMEVIKHCPELSELIFCSATIPKAIDMFLREHYPDAMRLVTPQIHRLPRHIEFKVVEVFRPPYRDRKDLALLQALYAILKDASEPDITKRVIVFVNSKKDVEPLVNMLNNKGYPAIGISGNVPSIERPKLLEDFVGQPSPRTSEIPLKVLVATDIVARGVDMNRVRNVILYDMPFSSADLLHRSGRTGRRSGAGRVIMLVAKKDNQGWIRGLQRVISRGESLA